VQNGTKQTESSELHRYPAVDTHRKRKLRDYNITENVSWRVPIWYHTFRISILFSIHTDYIDLEYNIACIHIQFSDKAVAEIQHLDSLHLSKIYERAYQMPITGFPRTFQTGCTRQTTPLALPNYFILNPLQTKRRLLHLKPQSVPRCKHFSSRL
jgi:hypothetical protein